jgi:hypothetical protein
MAMDLSFSLQAAMHNFLLLGAVSFWNKNELLLVSGDYSNLNIPDAYLTSRRSSLALLCVRWFVNGRAERDDE